MPGELLTSIEAADYLGWSDQYVRQLARERRIPCLKLGRQWRFPAIRLREWVLAGQPNPAEQPDLFGGDSSA